MSTGPQTTFSLQDVVSDFAWALGAVDAMRPVWTSRSGRVYQPGIGPHAEDAVVARALEQMRGLNSFRDVPIGQFLLYPNARRQKCDLWIGDPVEWCIEVKMARFRGDNGKPDDTSLKDVLSPYDADRSALTDSVKLARSQLPGSKAVVIYGFDYADRSLDPCIEAFETLARERVRLGPRCEVALPALVHPVHAEGRVFGWQVS